MAPLRVAMTKGFESKGHSSGRIRVDISSGVPSDPRGTQPLQAPVRSDPHTPQAPSRSNPHTPHALSRSNPHTPHAPSRPAPKAPTRSNAEFQHHVGDRPLHSSGWQTNKLFGIFEHSPVWNGSYNIDLGHSSGHQQAFQHTTPQRVVQPLAPHQVAHHPIHEDQEHSNEELLGMAKDLAEDDEHAEQEAPCEHAPSAASPFHDGSVAGQSSILSKSQFIEPVGNDSFRPAEIIRRIIKECVIVCYKDGWTTKRTCDQSAVNLWFEKFKQLFHWDPAKDTWVRRNSEKKVSKLLSGRWSYSKRKEGKIPIMTTPEGLRLAKEKWEDPKYKEIQETNKHNSRGESTSKGHSRHRMGSIPLHAAKEIFAIEIGREPSTRETYKQFKVKKNSTYLDLDDEEIVGRLDDVERRQREDETQFSLVEDIETYASVVGVMRRGLPRLLGSAATVVEGTQFNKKQQSAISSPSINSYASTETVHLSGRIDKVDDGIKSLQETMREMMQAMTVMAQNLASRSHPPPDLRSSPRSSPPT